MMHYVHSLKGILSLVITVIIVSIGTGFPTSVKADAGGINQASDKASSNRAKKEKIRKEEENTLRLKDKSSAKRAKILAMQYEQSANVVARQGGDPKPLRDAAAYFRNQSK